MDILDIEYWILKFQHVGIRISVSVIAQAIFVTAVRSPTNTSPCPLWPTCLQIPGRQDNVEFPNGQREAIHGIVVEALAVLCWRELDVKVSQDVGGDIAHLDHGHLLADATVGADGEGHECASVLDHLWLGRPSLRHELERFGEVTCVCRKGIAC